MEKIAAKKVYYEIKETLGRGLTSRVYKAFRRDSEGLTSQEVALKVIYSKKDVQILKQEFEALSKIRSKYCVGILAWENLSKGPALVLEYIDGITLYELFLKNGINDELSEEILVQIQLGLQKLHRNGIFHGDLNLKNIMVNTDGIVKLIDFGFSNGSDEHFLTPQFASPERLLGHSPDATSDLFSLDRIAEVLLKKQSQQQQWKHLATRGSKRRAIGKLVKSCKNTQFNSTQRKMTSKHNFQSPNWLRICNFAVIFLFFLGAPLLYQQEPQFHELNIRTDKWFRFSINGTPQEYGPLVEKNLRQGKYKLKWEASSKEAMEFIDLNQSKTILLQL